MCLCWRYNGDQRSKYVVPPCKDPELAEIEPTIKLPVKEIILVDSTPAPVVEPPATPKIPTPPPDPTKDEPILLDRRSSSLQNVKEKKMLPAELDARVAGQQQDMDDVRGKKPMRMASARNIKRQSSLVAELKAKQEEQRIEQWTLIDAMSIKELKEYCKKNGRDTTMCTEKRDLIEMAKGI